MIFMTSIKQKREASERGCHESKKNEIRAFQFLLITISDRTK